MSTPERPPDDSRYRVTAIDKTGAAVRQLENAILLWFAYGDEVSIHTLSKAANDLLAALSDKKGGRISTLKTWLEAQSRTVQDLVREMDNFFKHGYRDINAVLKFSPFYAEIVMLDSVDCYEFLYDRRTPLMSLYWTRFLVCNSDFLGPEPDLVILESREVYGLHKLSRREFLEKLWPTFSGSQ
jgi:hypothetical protein